MPCRCESVDLSNHSADYFIESPVNTTAVDGDQVIFSCALMSGMVDFEWQFVDSSGEEAMLPRSVIT